MTPDSRLSARCVAQSFCSQVKYALRAALNKEESMDARHSGRVVASIGLLLVLVIGGMALVPRAVQAAPSAQLSLSFDDPAPLAG